jgi:hypothetical protein
MTQAPHPPGAPGPVDVRRALRNASRPQPLAELTREGRRSLAIVSKARIVELINRAVLDLVGRLRAEDAGRRARQEKVDAEAEETRSFFERLAELAREVERTGRAREELEGARTSLLREIDDLREEIVRQKALAAVKREDALDRSPYLGAPDVDRQLATMVAETCRARAPGATATEAERLELLLRDLVLRVAREERARLRPGAAADRALWRTEKRIEKLYTQLDAMERALRLLSGAKVQNHPLVQSALRELGLISDDKYREKKREMLKVVLDTNQEIRRRHRDLAARGITLSTPAPLQ